MGELPTVPIDYIVRQVMDGQSGKAFVAQSEIETVYRRCAAGIGAADALLTVVRADSRVICQFSGRSLFRVVIEDPRGMVDKSLFSEFVPPDLLTYFDVRGARQGFGAFLLTDLQRNLRWLVLVWAVFLLGFVSFGSRSGLTSFFAVTSQVVSVFSGVFVVFTASQRPDSPLDVDLFGGGVLADHHQIDRHVTILAIVTAFLALFGAAIGSSQLSVARRDFLMPGGVVRSVDAFAVVLTALALAVLSLLTLLFAALPDYLEARKHNRFAVLAEQLLDEEHSQAGGERQKI